MRRDKWLRVRVRDQTKRRWQYAAAADGRTLSEWVRLKLDDAARRQMAAQEQDDGRGR